MTSSDQLASCLVDLEIHVTALKLPAVSFPINMASTNLQEQPRLAIERAEEADRVIVTN